ncbi:MAG: T9SS type A sorting domain-containing protein [Muribaculaceae bacterium]|nr:T9SS type A sorting domain-containing protein [Muribaculaceae bacterium]
MRKKLLLLFLLCCGLPALAQSAATLLVVSQTDGTKSTFPLSEKPEITFSGSDCVFKSTEAELTVSRAIIDDFHFIKQSTAINGAETDCVYAEIIAPGTVLIRGVAPADVSVFDVNGNAVRADIGGTKEALAVSVANLAPGVYILKFASYSLKFVNQ